MDKSWSQLSNFQCVLWTLSINVHLLGFLAQENSRCKNQLYLNSTVCLLHNEHTYHIYVYICTKYGVTMPNHTFPVLCHGGQLHRTMVAVECSYELRARSGADFDGCIVFVPRSLSFAKGKRKVWGYTLIWAGKNSCYDWWCASNVVSFPFCLAGFWGFHP